MLTKKQIKFLKSTAHSLKPITQIGKNGVTEELITDISNYLFKHELMKVSILDNCNDDKKTVANQITESGIEVVQIIGRTLVLYKENPELNDRIRLPRD